MKKCFLFVFALLHCSIYGLAQFGYNPNVKNPVLEDDIMFRKIVIRKINFSEKQNKGFSSHKEFGANFLDLLKEAITGEAKVKPIGLSITPYDPGFGELGTGRVSDKKMSTLSPEEMKEVAIAYQENYEEAKKKYPNVDPKLIGCTKTERDQQGVDINQLVPYGQDKLSLQMVEEVVFDKRRSRMYINIIAFLLVGECEDGAKPIAAVRYKDVDRYFRALYVESNQQYGKWYNPKNDRRHMCVMDAFELRLFSSRITQISNPENKELSEITNGNISEELYKSQEAEMELMEFEHNLWEF
ncbi:type IX secretion system ring subunit PorN/GldN [Raineya orbicola]|uniref:GldN: gliding motility associated protein GldN n=1 Tax=Raineya orbicola TaxID=2016530 RepID=A0A2N3IIE0_9BACT|nr:gliding motility protein GldN [Raineya orbicola]PKQ70041.1 GldN: gliding motility associated protein GldN [Raineya orbicola]